VKEEDIVKKENKMAAPSAEVRAALSEFLGAFEAFKDANDRRLAELESKRADIVTAHKVERIDRALTEQKAALDRLAINARQPELGRFPEHAKSEHKTAFDAYLRKGAASALLETKDLSTVTGAEGGYIVPDETERLIERRLLQSSPIRAIATVRQVGSSSFKKPVSLSDAVGGWVAETATRDATDASTLELLDFPTAELYAMPAATQTLLDDTFINLDEWLAEEIEEVFAVQEGTAFVTGDGTNKPKGFLAYDKVADATAEWGEIGYIATGAAGAFPASNPTDKLIDLVYAPKAAFRANGRFVMNKATVSAVRKFKDADGNYIWQASRQAGEPASLLGYPVTEAEDMPSIAADAHAIAFGDFRKGYLVVDRAGVRVLRDPYSAKPHVLFYTTKRVGGGVQDFDAIKLLKFAAS
jgi:HK97 family phage major capsid protein